MIVRLILLFSFFYQQSIAQYNPDIRVNQEGYYSSGSKEAILVGDLSEKDFFIVNINSKDTVFTGKTGIKKPSKNSSLVCQSLEFSSIKTSGRLPGSYTRHRDLLSIFDQCTSASS
jgi:hypothetical protein